MRRSRQGFGAASPRAVAERVHRSNKEKRSDNNNAEMNIAFKINTFDLQDFFTNIPRAAFLADLDAMVQRCRAWQPGAQFF